MPRTKTNEEFIQEVQSKFNGEYTVLGKYVNNKTKVLVRHNICGNEFETLPNNLLRDKGGCKICKYEKFSKKYSKGIDKFKEEVNDIYGNEYEVLDNEYINDKHYLLIRHHCTDTTYRDYHVRPDLFINQGKYICECKKNNKVSNKEEEIYNFITNQEINKNGYNYLIKVVRNSRSIIQPKELDIYVPDKKVAFEFDGLYYHSNLYKYNDYHINKTDECIKQGIRLIHIFEDEWDTKKDIVQDHIKNILGLTPLKIYARNCYVKEISKTDKNIFLNCNHIQGKDISNINLGLFYEDNLVAVMTFCKPRRSLGQQNNSSYDYELSRYATILNYSIIGGFSKLLKYFERTYEWNKIITYADRRWSNGNLYLKNNFTYLRCSKPNYWYFKPTDTSIRYHRYGFRKQVLKEKFPNIYSPEKTEEQIMKESGYLRIYDCGNMVFEYTRKE